MMTSPTLGSIAPKVPTAVSITAMPVYVGAILVKFASFLLSLLPSYSSDIGHPFDLGDRVRSVDLNDLFSSSITSSVLQDVRRKYRLRGLRKTAAALWGCVDYYLGGTHSIRPSPHPHFRVSFEILTDPKQNEAYKTDIPKIGGIPEASNALPFVGHLHLLGGRKGKNDASVFTQWGDSISSDIVQCRFGNQRTIIVRNFSIIRHLWIHHKNDLIDRPHQPGFLDKLGVDLTGSPMTDQIRKCRAAGMRALGKVINTGFYT